MFNNVFCKEEEILYEKIIELLEWKIKGDNKELFQDFFPVTISGKKLVKLDSNIKKIDYKKFITFKPLKNNKHCQFIIERLFDEEEVGDIFIIKDDNRKYGSKIVQKDTDEIISEVSGYNTEIDAKFRILCKYFFGNELDDLITSIKKFDTDHAVPDLKDNKKKDVTVGKKK